MAFSSARPHAGWIVPALRAAAGRAPAAVARARFRALPALPSIARLTVTAVFAYLLATMAPGSTQPVLAPLTAVLVVQATLYQTIRHAVQRVASVVAGVLLALVLSAALGFTWWSLGLAILAALVIGSVLNLGEHMLEVPISAMLILSLDTRAAATGRLVDTLIGAAAGLAGGMLLSPVRVQPAEEAIGALSQRMAGLLEEIASGLTGPPGAGEAEAWLARARSLTGEVQRADGTLGEAEDSLRLKPRALRSARTAVPLRNGLETLEHTGVTIRGLTRSLTDETRLPEEERATLTADTAGLLAEMVRRLAAAVRAYGGLIRADLAAGHQPDTGELEHCLSQARDQHGRLAPVLQQAPAPGAAGWQLRGEILGHLGRLTGELQAEQLARAREHPANPPWLRAARVVWPRLSVQAAGGIPIQPDAPAATGGGDHADSRRRGRLRPLRPPARHPAPARVQLAALLRPARRCCPAARAGRGRADGSGPGRLRHRQRRPDP